MSGSKNIDEEYKKMSENDYETIVAGARSNNKISNLRAILFGTKFRITEPEYIDLLLNKLKYSGDRLFGMPIAEYTLAALDILNIQKYKGDNTSIRRLIESGMDFYL